MSSCDTYGTQCIDTGSQLTADSVAFNDALIESGCASVQCALDKIAIDEREHSESRENPHEVDIGQVPHNLNDHLDASFPTPLDGQVLTYIEASNAFEAQTSPAGVTDHLLLTNIGTNAHELIDEHLADLTQNPHMITPAMISAEPENANIQAHITDITTNPHQVTYAGLSGDAPANGYNVLINGGLRVDQRETWLNDWTNVPADTYGPDRWKKNPAGNAIEQHIEEINYLPGRSYTLSINGVFESTLVAPASGVWVVTVPLTAINIKLELGAILSPFEPRNITDELLMCQRYYYRHARLAQLRYAGVATLIRSFGFALSFPVRMRAVPVIGIVSSPIYTNCSNATGLATVDDYQLSVTPDGTGWYSVEVGTFEFNAELY